MGAIELFLTLIGAAATAVSLGLFAHDAMGIPIDTICVERDISRTSILHISTYQRFSATHPPGGGPFLFFATNFYPIEEGARRWANG